MFNGEIKTRVYSGHLIENQSIFERISWKFVNHVGLILQFCG